MVKRLARECGFELAGIAPAEPLPEALFYLDWVRRGNAGEMGYLRGRRAEARLDPKSLLPSARSVICIGKLYNGPQPCSADLPPGDAAWISRYAWGEDYHGLMRKALRELAGKLADATHEPFEWKICVDTAPVLERTYARRAGLGWIGRNACLINQHAGSWFFLGELLVSLEFEPDAPPPDRCGSCTRCVDACPTTAIVPTGREGGPDYELDSRRCISYLTIELRGEVPEAFRPLAGNNVFGCDICQDVCPWNRKAAMTLEQAFAPRHFAPALETLAALGEDEFREMFRGTPVTRTRYSGFLRNVAVAMGASGLAKFRAPLERLASQPDPLVAEHARWALGQIGENEK
jgi:epoxyqueuosine reductase